MTELAYWANILLWPASVVLVVVALDLLHRRDEARWAREARDRKGSRSPAE